MADKRVIVVGGGLAGLTATLELLERGMSVTILEQEKNLGGNSSKATDGICCAGSQWAEGDKAEDLIAMGGGAAADLFAKGGKDLDWLVATAELDPSTADAEGGFQLVMTPGHAKARTLSTKKFFPGMVVTYEITRFLEKFELKYQDRLTILTQTEVTKLRLDGDKVVGVDFMQRAAGGKEGSLDGSVLMATGGYAGEPFKKASPEGLKGSLLEQYQKGLISEKTTCDSRSIGTGIKMAMQVGSATDKLGQVVMCPTSTRMPDDGPLNFILSDVMCGTGAVLLDKNGRRFTDEKASNAVRIAAMQKSQGPFWLVAREGETGDYLWRRGFYTQKRLVKEGKSADLAKAMNIPGGNLDPLFDRSAILYYAEVMKALYTCAGGVCTSSNGEVLTTESVKKQGFFAAGEVCAIPFDSQLWSVSGVPLLYCIYSGRLAGQAAAAYANGGKLPDVVGLPKKDGAAAPKTEEKAEKPLEELTKEELIEKVKQLMEAGPPAPAPKGDDGPPGITMEEIAKHDKKNDAWIALNGKAIDVTKWMNVHPGQASAIMPYIGQDCSEEWNMIHKAGTVERFVGTENGPVIIGDIGKPGGNNNSNNNDNNGGGGGGLTMADVEKHNTKGDCWVVVNGQVLDVVKWIPVHPGGEQAIMNYAGGDATDEWNTIHKAGTVERFVGQPTGPVVVGPLSGSKAVAPPPPPQDDYPPPPDGDGDIPGTVGALYFMVKALIRMLLLTVFFTGNFVFKFDNNRNGTIRSAMMLLVFTIVHVAGNSFDFWLGGPEEMNGETYFFERQQAFWPYGKMTDAGPLEIYIVLAFGLHVSVALKRSWDITMGYCLYTGKWNMLLSGLVILTFLIKHLQDFKFYHGYDYSYIRAPKLLVNPLGLPEGHLWIDPDAKPILVKDVYTHEFAVFKDPMNTLFYLVAVSIFCAHMILGWAKVITADALQIPKGHLETVKWIGWIAAISVASLYASLPIGTYFSTQLPVKHFPAPAE